MMRHAVILGVLILLIGCGSSPTGPGPIPPSSITVSGTLTDTVSGAVIGSFVQTVNSLPALIDVTAPGHHPRRARVSSATPTVDLIPVDGFDLNFYRQLARNGHEAPGALEPLRVLSASPSIYLQRTGLSDATVAALEQAARAVMPALTGGRLQVAAWETGEAARAIQAGWIMVETYEDQEPFCGRAIVGGGQIRINTKPNCVDAGYAATNFAHELGHALGFRHVASGLMQAPAPRGVTLPSSAERAAGAVAYARSAGNLDVDQDSLTTSLIAPLVSD